MATFTQKQAQEMFQKAEAQGISKQDFFKSAIEQGHSFEGLDTQQVLNQLNGVKEQKPNTFQNRLQDETMGGIIRTKNSGKLAEKIAGFVGGKELSQGAGMALGSKQIFKANEENLKTANTQLTEINKLIEQARASGRDTSRLENARNFILDDIEQSTESVAGFVSDLPSNKEVIGSALQLAGTAAGGQAIGGGVRGTGIVSGIKSGAATGAKTGALFGGIQGVASGLKADDNFETVVKTGLTGAVAGGLLGGILGSVTGGISGGVQGKKLREKVLQGQVELGIKQQPKLREKVLQIAKEQGFDEVDINFINSLSSVDKQKAKKMIQLAEKATKDKRLLERPIDVVGDSMVDRVKFIKQKNNAAGKAVDVAAKSLKGQSVAVDDLQNSILSQLDEAGIIIDDAGNLDFNNSVFKNLPKVQKEIAKVIKSAPDGTDAYQLHIFKKSLDEMVTYGTGGEGLKGQASNILKGIRNSVDNTLDNNFEAYNLANQDYKITREVIDQANDLFGKKVGIGKERGGQLLRSVFSNNTQRPRVLQLIENLDNTSKKYGGEFDDNLLDQALFTEILEDVYGTKATTSLQGEVTKALKGTKSAIEMLINPVQALGELAAKGAEKGISDENKRKVLLSLLNQAGK